MLNKIKQYFKEILIVFQTVLMIVLIIQVWILSDKFGKPSPAKKDTRRSTYQPRKINVDMDDLIKGAQYQGAKDGKVVLAFFNSYTCGFCRRVRDTLNLMLKKYPDDLKLVYKHYNRNQLDSKAGQAAECAGEQGKFWEMFNKIFDQGIKKDLNEYAAGIGLNKKKFKKCLTSGKYLAKTQADTKQGQTFGIRGTPGFIINSKMFTGYKKPDAFGKIIEAEL
jgi:protein-disulfide isomerase